ncbi:hypothetical protein DXG01_004741 [Tephrocybe rancida]|nr:hypothetical protein DXG01_004741 [Tephrocybe rancida]
MKLNLSGSSPLNSTFTNDDGQALYKVETKIWAISPTSNITCVIPNDIPRREEEDTNISMQDRFAYFGHVEHNMIASAVLHFGDQRYEAKDYFKKDGWGAYGRNRVFTGLDGREYKWLLRSFSPKARFCPSSRKIVDHDADFE